MPHSNHHPFLSVSLPVSCIPIKVKCIWLKSTSGPFKPIVQSLPDIWIDFHLTVAARQKHQPLYGLTSGVLAEVD